MGKILNFAKLEYKSFALFAFIFAFIVDQVSKNFFYFYFLFNNSIEVTSFFSLTFVWNTGMSFSILSSQPVLFNILVSSFALLFILFMVLKYFNTKSIYFAIALGFLVAGSLGNIVDRVRFSAVIDFIHLHYKGYNFPVFNFADIFINIAVILILFDQFLSNKKVLKNEK